ncbi:hypothetical protein D3C85_775520 [compost metagenome]
MSARLAEFEFPACRLLPGEPVPYTFEPRTPAEWKIALADAQWRIHSGQLYQVMTKSANDEGETIVPFKPNRAQRRFLARLWYRNVILKARQLGFTTLVAILWLDHALFNENQRCVIVAQDLDKAGEIFRDKVLLAYDRLPLHVRLLKPVVSRTADEIMFANNSAVKVSTSARGGTPHRLHVSEMGKIGAKFPHKAKEIATGSFTAVPIDGIIIVESTAEGQEGRFYKLVSDAMETADTGHKLTVREHRFHFFPWHEEPGYVLDARVVMSKEDDEYFHKIEALIGKAITPQQRAWYVSTRKSDYSGDEELMWQEYPSTPEEAFQVSTDGTYYAKQLTAIRKSKRVGFYPYVEGFPVYTFWDIGASDGTGIWLMQDIRGECRFIVYIEGWGESYGFFITILQSRGYTWGTHYVPHDAGHKRQQATDVIAPIDTLTTMGLGGSWQVVDRVEDVNTGIQMTRQKLSMATFNEAGCKKGLVHLGLYRKEWDEKAGTWRNKPRHDEHSEAADALRQWGQAYYIRAQVKPGRPTALGSWRAR